MIGAAAHETEGKLFSSCLELIEKISLPDTNPESMFSDMARLLDRAVSLQTAAAVWRMDDTEQSCAWRRENTPDRWEAEDALVFPFEKDAGRVFFRPPARSAGPGSRRSC